MTTASAPCSQVGKLRSGGEIERDMVVNVTTRASFALVFPVSFLCFKFPKS